MTMLVAGVIVLVAAFAPTSANAVIPNSSLVPAGPATFSSSCTGPNDPNDPTNTILTGTVGNPVALPARITTNAVDSPSDGENFTLSLTWQFTLPAQLAGIAVATGNTTLVQSNATLPLNADSGATAVPPPPVDAGPTTVQLGDGTQDVSFQSVVTETFTRVGTGTPVVLSPGTTTTTSTAGQIGLHLICTPTNVTPLTLNDQAGPTPVATTAVPAPTVRAAAPTTAPAGGAGTGGTSTGASPTATSGSGLARTGFHPELLYIGIALLGAGYALSLTGRRMARAGSRSG